MPWLGRRIIASATNLALMLDVEQRYYARRRLCQPHALWRNLASSGSRRRSSTLIWSATASCAAASLSPLSPAGNWLLDAHLIALGIELGAWTSVRVDTTIAGGITPTLKIMALAEAAAMNCELQCWGYTLTQAANLHLMLARGNCSYFEQPVPYAAFEAGSLDTIRTDAEGYVHAPSGAGLGIRVDWPSNRSGEFHQL